MVFMFVKRRGGLSVFVVVVVVVVVGDTHLFWVVLRVVISIFYF